MTRTEREELRNIITFGIETAKKDVLSLKELSKPVAPDDAIGRLTRMEAINSRSINEAALEKTRAKLSGLQRALGEIDGPDFGICRLCEEPIPHARLKLIPECLLCVVCARKQ